MLLDYYKQIDIKTARIPVDVSGGVIYNGVWEWKRKVSWSARNLTYLRVIAVEHPGAPTGIQVGNGLGGAETAATKPGHFVVIATDIESGTSVINETNTFIERVLHQFYWSHGMNLWNTVFIDHYVQDHISRSLRGEGDMRRIDIGGCKQEKSIIPEHRGAFHDGEREFERIAVPDGDPGYLDLSEEDLDTLVPDGLWRAEHYHSIDNGKWPTYDPLMEKMGYIHEAAPDDLIELVINHQGKVNVTINESQGIEVIKNRYMVMASNRGEYGPLGFDYILVTERGEPKNPANYTRFPWKSVVAIDTAGKKGKRLWRRNV